MYYPTLEEVKALAGQGNLVPVYREIMADLETPVSAYLKIARGRYSFLLESVEGGEQLARLEAAVALGDIGAPAADAVPILELVSEEDPAPAVRAAAKRALEQIRGG